jgi:hypothetical protein
MSIDESWKEEGLPVLHRLDTNKSEFDKAHCFFSVGYLAGLKRAQESMKQNLNSFLKD